MKPYQKDLAISSHKITESIQDTSQNPTSTKKKKPEGIIPEGRDQQFVEKMVAIAERSSHNQNMSGNLRIQLPNDSILSRHVTKPRTPLTGTDALNPLSIEMMGLGSDASASLTPSNFNYVLEKHNENEQIKLRKSHQSSI